MKYSNKHPECRDDEVFFGFCTDADFHQLRWTCKRKGTVTYTLSGTKIESIRGYYPVFLRKDELPPDILDSIIRRTETLRFPVEDNVNDQ